jgi:hypothetical protein
LREEGLEILSELRSGISALSLNPFVRSISGYDMRHTLQSTVEFPALKRDLIPVQESSFTDYRAAIPSCIWKRWFSSVFLEQNTCHEIIAWNCPDRAIEEGGSGKKFSAGGKEAYIGTARIREQEHMTVPRLKNIARSVTPASFSSPATCRVMAGPEEHRPTVLHLIFNFFRSGKRHAPIQPNMPD